MVHTYIDPAIPNNGFIDVIEEQDKMTKRFYRIKFTHSDEASMDFSHIMKTLNVPLVIFDKIIR